MQKIKLGVIFGGESTEHDVSVISGTSVIKNLNKGKYEIYPIYIDKNGKWFEYKENDITLKVGDKIDNIKEIKNPMEYLKTLDKVFPVLHGLKGEDGTIQGMFEILGIPYVGSRVLASSLAMDKAYAKVIFAKANIMQANYIYIKKYDEQYIFVAEDFSEEILSLDEMDMKVEEKIKYPIFIKPSNSGSSVGISKAKDKDELKLAIELAGKYDKKILIEEGIKGKEIECAVLGNEDVKASILGEIIPAEEFYSYDAKYKNSESKTIMPARLPDDITIKVQELAKKAYKALDCKGLARVDFFVDGEKIYINEINTMPGFTEISMYPKLWEKTGIKYTELLDKIIELGY